MIYIEGYSLICSLGESAKTSVETLKNGTIDPTKIEENILFYKMHNTEESEYYNIMEKMANVAIKDANLSQEDVEDMTLFIGTSSAKLPINETYAKDEGLLLKDLNMSEICSIVSQRMGMKGSLHLISTACTSSSNALIQAHSMIESGLIEKALVIGVELYNALSLKGFESFMLLSKDKIKPFDTNRDGVILGEAVSAVVLGKAKSDMALFCGSSKVDTSSITSPSPENLAKVMQEAIANASIEPQDIHTIKTHSTATRQNDNAEAKAIHMLFDTVPQITALKPYIGHTMGACGSNELVLLAEALKQGFIPKTINFETQDDECNIKPMVTKSEMIEGYYLLNYFGFGGNNTSLVMKYSRG